MSMFINPYAYGGAAISDAAMAAAIWAKLVSAYPFDGGLYDLKGGNHLVRNDSFNDGTMSYATGIGGASGAAKIKRWITGQGNVDNINCRNIAQNLPTGAFAMGGFFKFQESPSALQGVMMQFGGDYFASNAVIIDMSGGTPCKLRSGFSTPTDSTGLSDLSRDSGNLSNGQRIFASVERTAGGVAAVYYDAVQSGATVTDATALSASDTVAFGAGGGSLPDTLLDECFILNADLTTAERDWLYNSGTGRSWRTIRTLAAVAMTLNPNDASALLALSGGNLTATKITSAGWVSARSVGAEVDTFSTAVKPYWEVVIDSSSANGVMVGIGLGDAVLTNFAGSSAAGWAYYTNGNKYHAGSAAAYGAAFTTGDVLGIGVDPGTGANDGALYFWKNGAAQGAAYTGLPNGVYFPMISAYDIGESMTCRFTAASIASLPAGYTAIGG